MRTFKLLLIRLIMSLLVAGAAFSSPVHAAGKSRSNAAKRFSEPGYKVVAYAMKFLGNPYRYGGTSLRHGTDCSGFTMKIFAHFGKTIPRTSRSQRKAGKRVKSLRKAKPGDLICYDGHVAIYLGNNKIIHASSRKTGIKISKNAAYRRIICIRRIIK